MVNIRLFRGQQQKHKKNIWTIFIATMNRENLSKVFRTALLNVSSIVDVIHIFYITQNF